MPVITSWNRILPLPFRRFFSYGIGSPSAVTYTVTSFPTALRNNPIDHRGFAVVVFFAGAFWVFDIVFSFLLVSSRTGCVPPSFERACRRTPSRRLGRRTATGRALL